jgi:hypothetical protein
MEICFARRRHQTAHIMLSLIATTMNIIFFWNVPSCSLVEGYQLFRKTCSHHDGEEVSTLKMEAAGFLESFCVIYNTTQCDVPEASISMAAYAICDISLGQKRYGSNVERQNVCRRWA